MTTLPANAEGSAVTDDAMDIFRLPNKSWFVQYAVGKGWGCTVNGQFQHFASQGHCIPLLPLLASSWQEAIELVRRGQQLIETPLPFPFEEVLVTALVSGSEYWSSCATQWLSQGFPISEQLHTAITRQSNNKAVAQADRQQLRKLAAAWRRS